MWEAFRSHGSDGLKDDKRRNVPRAGRKSKYLIAYDLGHNRSGVGLPLVHFVNMLHKDGLFDGCLCIAFCCLWTIDDQYLLTEGLPVKRTMSEVLSSFLDSTK